MATFWYLDLTINQRIQRILTRTNLYKTLNILFRIVIIVASLGFIYYKVLVKGDISGLIDNTRSFSNHPFFLKGLIFIFLLMFLNWLIESYKWYLLARRIGDNSFFRVVQSVIAGISVSIFTPNRTAEFVGRVFVLKTSDSLQAIFLSIIGSMSQLLVTILMGTISFSLLFRDVLPGSLHLSSWMEYLIIPGIILLDVLLLSAYLRVPYLSLIARKLTRDHFPKFQEYLDVIGTLSRIELIRIILLSTLRFLVFSFQFYIMLYIFGIELPLFQALLLIALIFFSLAVIPTFAFSELGVRGSVSLFLIGEYYAHTYGLTLNENQSLAVVLAAGLLWMINLAIPAILGIPALLRLKFFKR